jgi:hypothetical protein
MPVINNYDKSDCFSIKDLTTRAPYNYNLFRSKWGLLAIRICVPGGGSVHHTLGSWDQEKDHVHFFLFYFKIFFITLVNIFFMRELRRSLRNFQFKKNTIKHFPPIFGTTVKENSHIFV